MKRKSWIFKLILMLIIFIIIIGYISSEIIIIKSHLDSGEIIFGIIDGQLTINSNNVIANNNNKVSLYKQTHGDDLIIFANQYYPNSKIYYYDASDENGIVDTDGIIEGLQWMKDKGVRNVNISMSSSIYSEELKGYLDKLHSDLKIFASYHNLEQTLDYPAMYKDVVGSGKRNNIPFKGDDIEYKSNIIILLTKNIKKYSGNSFLSIITIINSIINNSY